MLEKCLHLTAKPFILIRKNVLYILTNHKECIHCEKKKLKLPVRLSEASEKKKSSTSSIEIKGT